MVLNSLLLMKKEIDLMQEILAILMIIVVVLSAIIAIFMVVRMNIRHVHNFKRNFVSMSIANLCAILTIAVVAVTFYNFTQKDSHGSYKFTSLTEIKDSITVENDKVKIDKLSKDYKYVSDYQELDCNETQIFKLEENKFYEKRWLVDQYGRRFQLDSEEYTMLIDKGDKHENRK